MQNTPGIILKTQFTSPNRSTSKGFSGFVDYIEREEATESEKNFVVEDTITKEEFENYLNYMDRFNGMFSLDSETLSLEKIKNIKSIFREAEQNGSIMWQDVVSFNNNFLEKEKIYDPIKNTLDEKRLISASKKMMNSFIEKEKLNEPYWVGAIHRNTDNIHIHFSTVERKPSRPEKEYEGNYESRGKRKQSTIDSMKTSFVNELGIHSEHYKAISKKRDKAINNLKQVKLEDKFLSLSNYIKFEKTINELFDNLPDDWEYKVARNHVSYKFLNSNDKKLVDNAISILATNDNNLKSSIHDYHESIEKLNDKLIETYGLKENPSKDFKHKRSKEFNERLGNCFLKEMGRYKRETNKNNYVDKKNKSKITLKKGNANKSLSYQKKYGYSTLEKYFWRTQKNMIFEMNQEMSRIIRQKRKEDIQAYENMIHNIDEMKTKDINYF